MRQLGDVGEDRGRLDSIIERDVTVETVVKGCILGQAARLLTKLGISQESVERFAREIIKAFKP